jgi:signal peptidase I
MEPTIRCARASTAGCTGAADDRVVAEGPAPVGRLEIIAFKAPPEAVSKCGNGGTFLQRVIGLPGETVREDDHGFIWVRRPGSIKFVRLKESYVSARDRLSDMAHFGLTWHVPRGGYFTMGDNRAESCDSRAWGSVPRSDVIGTVVEILRHG